ncbi:MAG TPA: fibronectin type III domain-containing protein [Myxococcaceae bacterium]|nr:fibronectin type III domain-containing protein [Myxococcaceae bacterium]
MHRRYPWAWMALVTLTALTGCLDGSSTPSVRRAPGAPTDVVVTAGDAEATVEWLAPADQGSSPLTGYEVTASPEIPKVSVDASTTLATVTGLTNGTAYTFTVRALNAVGAGPASAASSPVTPRSIPGAPRNVATTPGDGQVMVQWEAPASDGGGSLTGYKVTISPGDQTVSVDGATSSTTFTGLTNGTAYSFSVRALNDRGEGPAASSTATPRTVPTTPVEVLVTPGDGQAMVAWQRPGSDGGSPLTGYSVELQPGDQTLTVEASTLSTTVTGLTNGTKYTLTVRALNAAGSSQGISVDVTPYTVPGVLANMSLTASDEKIAVSWVNPTNNGGSPLTGFLVEASPGGYSTTFGLDVHSTELTGLTNGTEYTVTVRALNAAGHGLPTEMKELPGLYRAPVTYPALDGQLARRMVAEDFNGDSNMDVALCFPEAGRIGVLHGNGQGAFGAMQEIPVPNKPSTLVTFDFNNDTYRDLLVAGAATQDDQKFLVLLGNGDGTFQDPKSAATAPGITPRALVTGYFNTNTDFETDLATVNAEGSVSILLGNGDGTFQPPSTITLGSGSFTFELAAERLIGDFSMDLAVTMADGTHTLAILPGKGDGTFDAPQLVAAGSGTTCVKPVDLDMDFRADLLVCDTDASTLASRVHILTSDAITEVFSVARSYDAGKDVTELVTGDFDGDMNPDFATAHNVNDWDVSVFRGQGDGTFPKVDRYMGDTLVNGIATASFDNTTGRADLALCGSRNVTVLLAR